MKNEQTSAKGGGSGGDGGPQSLTVDHVLSSFYILGLGLVIAGFCFVIELIEAKVKSSSWYRKLNKN